MFVDDHDPVLPFPGSLDRTVDDTGGMVALVAEGGQEVAGDIRESSLFNDFHPASKNPERNAILRFACDRTAMAADAASEIDQHGISFIFGCAILHD